MVRPLRLQPQHIADLTEIATIGRAGIEAVTRALEKIDPPLIAASALRSEIQDSVESADKAESLARQVIRLATYCRALDKSPSDAREALLAGLDTAQLDSEKKDAIKEIAPHLEALIANESVKLSAKALHLGYDYDCIYSGGNINTDIRPVFDDDREVIVGAVISQIIRIHFSRGPERRELSLALDNDDIDDLIEKLQTAKRKSEHARALVMEKAGLKAFVVGEETYGYG